MLVPEINSELILVITTEVDIEHAKILAEKILKRQLAACISFQSIQSQYWWRNSLKTSDEIQLLIKTKRNLLEKLHALVKEIHTYDTPEFIFLKVSSDISYENWILDSVIKA